MHLVFLGMIGEVTCFVVDGHSINAFYTGTLFFPDLSIILIFMVSGCLSCTPDLGLNLGIRKDFSVVVKIRLL